MVRMDENMPFLLQYENVAWYENGKVRILDRRIYPTVFVPRNIFILQQKRHIFIHSDHVCPSPLPRSYGIPPSQPPR